ncbi:phospholipase D family nuclease [Paraburkholderia kirstenboschensis]|uniref:phospholipase D n=1 Tax=Paraburkholderia kirstenboschensis TaxID=1245436 RepID=A0ABZ0EJM5_9BURK|nr:phospholipase D family protein [Paraburkholderia kirstenboschensis]WOD17130.1 phospholipase D family protein [Paraburkholderia kirstenboschensis]
MKLKVAVAASFTSLAICGRFANLGYAKSPLSGLLRWDSDSIAKPTGFQNSASYQLCFVPDGASCQDLLVSTIDRTQSKLRVQAYSFTSAPIAAAIKRAKDRGVDVKVILDKSQVSQRYSGATYLRNAGVDVVIDTKPAIAHNKVMIFDDEGVFTGSFNFTKSAQERNAENGIIIRGDTALTKTYLANWEKRYSVSSRY